MIRKIIIECVCVFYTISFSRKGETVLELNSMTIQIAWASEDFLNTIFQQIVRAKKKKKRK